LAFPPTPPYSRPLGLFKKNPGVDIHVHHPPLPRKASPSPKIRDFSGRAGSPPFPYRCYMLAIDDFPRRNFL